MTREIKFRAWDKDVKIMHYDYFFNGKDNGTGYSETISIINGEIIKLFWSEQTDIYKISVCNHIKNGELMQYTGLKDKNGLQEVYEGDIIDVYGKIKGNIYEIKEADKDQFDLVIQGFGTKAWLTTYQNAVDRGCTDAK